MKQEVRGASSQQYSQGRESSRPDQLREQYKPAPTKKLPLFRPLPEAVPSPAAAYNPASFSYNTANFEATFFTEPIV